MTPAAPCPRCGNTKRQTFTELVRTCNDDLKVAEWSECTRCHRWLAFRLDRKGPLRSC